jgi:hypothetical protein
MKKDKRKPTGKTGGGAKGKSTMPPEEKDPDSSDEATKAVDAAIDELWSRTGMEKVTPLKLARLAADFGLEPTEASADDMVEFLLHCASSLESLKPKFWEATRNRLEQLFQSDPGPEKLAAAFRQAAETQSHENLLEILNTKALRIDGESLKGKALVRRWLEETGGPSSGGLQPEEKPEEWLKKHEKEGWSVVQIWESKTSFAIWRGKHVAKNKTERAKNLPKNKRPS